MYYTGTEPQNSVHFGLSRQYGSAVDLRTKSAKGRENRKNTDNIADKRRERNHMNSSNMRVEYAWKSPPQENCLSKSASNIRRDQSPLRPKVLIVCKYIQNMI